MSSSALFDPAVRDVPAHDHWHPDIPGVAEILTGGSVRMECQGRVPGAGPGDLIVVDVLAVGRAGSVHAGGGHPGIIGCAPPAPVAVPSGARGRDVGGCRIAPLAAGSRVLLPVRVRGAKLSVGDLHFPAPGAYECDGAALPGWIDLDRKSTRLNSSHVKIS